MIIIRNWKVTRSGRLLRSHFLFFGGFGFGDLFLKVGLDLPAFGTLDNVNEAIVLRFVEGIVNFLVGQHIVAFALLGFHVRTDRSADAIHQYVIWVKRVTLTRLAPISLGIQMFVLAYLCLEYPGCKIVSNMDILNEHIMSRKERLAGAGVLAVTGVSALVLAQVHGLGLLNELQISNLIILPYIIAAVSLISAFALSVYISPEEHLWGSDDPLCDRGSCRHARH